MDERWTQVLLERERGLGCSVSAINSRDIPRMLRGAFHTERANLLGNQNDEFDADSTMDGQRLGEGPIIWCWTCNDSTMAKVLTDQPCPSRGCGIPLLRSTDGTVSFCVDCDKSPPSLCPSTGLSSGLALISRTAATSASAQSSTASMSDHPSRPSTPATSMSSTLSSPVFAPPAETEESLRRRQQSDRASAEMAKLLSVLTVSAGEPPVLTHRID